MSRIYFPLKTAVELFGDHETPEAVTRVKQAAALYDEVLIEDGLLTVNISTAGSNSFWKPWDWVDPEKLAHTRTPGEPGTPIGIGVQAQAGPGQPGEGPVRWFSQGELLIDYVAEFHTGVIDELAALDPDWFHIVAPGNTAGALGPELSSAIRGLDQRDFFDRNLMTDRNTFEKGWVSKSFNFDAVVAVALEASFNVTPLFNPMLQRDEVRPEHAGVAAIEILVPDLGGLPWEAILEFREHAGCDEARARLREFEEAAAAQGPETPRDFTNAVQREITDAFFAATKELAPKWGEAVVTEAAKTAIGFIPVAGPIISGTATAAEIAAAQADYNNSWHAALLKLRSWSSR